MRNIWDVPSSEYKETIPRGVVLNGVKVLLFNKIKPQREKSNVFFHRLFGRLRDPKGVIRGRPQRTSATFRGGGGTQLQTLADIRGRGVSGMQTSASLKK